MAYRRFKLPEISLTSATLATFATLGPVWAGTVASVASPEPISEAPNPRSVATVATVARVQPDCAGSADVARAGIEGVEIPTPSPAEPDFALAIPAPYRAAYADLCACCPAGVPVGRWQWALADGARFLGEWGGAAERLGWTANDLFGLHPTVPLSRMDHMGLCWLLKGQRVVLLTATEARFERG